MGQNLPFDRPAAESLHGTGHISGARLDLLSVEALPTTANPNSARNTLLGHYVGKVVDLFGTSPAEHRREAVRAENQLLQAAGVKLTAAQQSAQQVDLEAATNRDERMVRTGTGFLKAVALFLPDKAGRLASAAVYSADSIHLADSLGYQAVDALAGAGKGYALKRGFDHLGAKEMSLVPKAFLLGLGSRTAESLLDRHTYLDPKTGTMDIAGGFGRAGSAMFSSQAVASDIAIFGSAYLATRALPAAAADYLRRNPAAAMSLTAGVFGLSGGAIGEINAQHSRGQFDLSEIAHASLTQGAADGLAGYVGGKLGARLAPSETTTRNSQTERQPALVKGLAEGDAHLKIRRDLVLPNQGSGDSPDQRNFVMVGDNRHVRAFLEQRTDHPVLVGVAEVRGGTLGPTQSLLLHHSRPGDTPGALISRADITATCDPQLLPNAQRVRHVFPDHNGPIFASNRPGDSRLTISLRPPAPESGVTVRRLGEMTPSERLLAPEVPQRFRDIHDLEAMAHVLRHINEPTVKLMGGAESMVLKLGPNASHPGQMLRITDQPFDPSWGSRHVQTDMGPYIFDAPILTRPTQVTLNGEVFTYFIQQATRSPVTPAHAKLFQDLVARRSPYEFWDGGAHGLTTQLGYAPKPGGGSRLVLFDYAAVRPKLNDLSPAELRHSLPGRRRGQ